MRLGFSLILAAGSLLAASAPVYAGSTSPLLVVSTAAGETASGGRTASFEGTFDFANVVGVGYPLQIVVFQGPRFARYVIAGAVVTGTSAVLADGQLTDVELPTLLADGAPAAAGVRIASLTATAAVVTLPATFTSGATKVVLFTILVDGTVVSNPVDFVLP